MKYAVAFVLIMLCGLTLRSLTPEPVDHRTIERVLPPLQQAITDHGDAWRAELERGQRETPRGYPNPVCLRWYDEHDAAWPRVSWTLRAKMRVLRDWLDEDFRHGGGEGPRVSVRDSADSSP